MGKFRSPGAAGDPLFEGPVLDSLIYPFGLHFGSILASIFGLILGSIFILFSIRFFNDFGRLFVSIWGAILAPFGSHFEVKNRCKFPLEL